jgi:hypothetical protein
VKKFYDNWSDDEINNYVNENSTLVLFRAHRGSNEAEIIIHGELNDKQKLLLKVCIIGKFGGKPLNESNCVKINEYAREWYKDFIVAPKKVRVLNFKRKG